ncbi:MAG TPA: N-acetyl-gamma-glutamyl-phosphate reductase [Cytophagales bacterium]|nr:N-acetyl-gamma-glutamyl-phosphate reductase [Cytophagales bacterium]
MEKKIKVGIVGGAGYTGGELLRILLFHPFVDIQFVHSKSNAGNKVSSVHKDLLGYTELVFSGELSSDIDVLILCLGHGDAKKFLDQNKIQDSIKIIDLSHDFRIASPDNDFVYGLPELNKEKIKEAKKLANPGCFATCIELGLLPLASIGKLNNEVHTSGITGSTGAGQSLSPTSHFSWREGNVSVYKAFSHQHLKEINQSLRQLQSSFDKDINFIPYRGNFTRGIICTSYVKSDLSQEEARSLYKTFYKDHPFTIVSDENIDLKQVVNTNKCLVFVEKHGQNLMIISIIDNLVKGASGHAVQNLNLMFALKETEGLLLKPAGF